MENPQIPSIEGVAKMLFEVGMLANTPRSGFPFLGTGKQSVAEHLHRSAMIGMTLGLLDGTVDVGKLTQMCLLHDITEARTSDLNYTHQRYVTVDEPKALAAMTEALPFKQYWHDLLKEYHERQTREAILAKEADNLELLLSAKEQADLGNPRASAWIAPTILRLKTDLGKQLAEKILTTRHDAWWFPDENDRWFVDRSGKSATNNHPDVRKD
jgi:putative hydrolase of HD superfamily